MEKDKKEFSFLEWAVKNYKYKKKLEKWVSQEHKDFTYYTEELYDIYIKDMELQDYWANYDSKNK